MIQASDIRELRTSAVDHADTEALKARLRGLREARSPFYLGAEDLDLIFLWKLRAQFGRQHAIRATNAADAYVAVTRAAFAVRSADRDLELELRVGILRVLRGVGVPVASVILALTEPESYCVIEAAGVRRGPAVVRRRALREIPCTSCAVSRASWAGWCRRSMRRSGSAIVGSTLNAPIAVIGGNS